MMGERPMHDVFALTAHICTAPISIDVAIFRVIQCVKEFTNGATPSWAE
jgi:H+/gluconate symporter-like permease